MRSYRVQSMTLYWLFVAVTPLFFVVFGVLWLSVAVRSGTGMAIFGVVWIGACLWGGYRYVFMPHTIEVVDTGMIRFVGALRTSEMAPSEVISVRNWGGTFVEVKHTKGKILMLNQFTGFHQFLTELKAQNAAVKLRGV